jgi:cation:H+ antiporter
MILLLLIAGFTLLIAGAELLVRGASRLAAAVGVSPLVIGLTVVAFGTSAPELAVSVNAGLAGQPDIALGNVVGSNIFNVLFILGVAGLIAPMVVARQLVRLGVPLMIAASVVVLILGLDGRIGRLEGGALSLALLLYTGFLIRQSRKENSATAGRTVPEDFAHMRTHAQWLIDLALIAGGLALLVLGSRWLVESAVAIAQHLGVSELIIGLTIIAAGTSLPEVATSVIASIRGERDIAVGNVVGSNIINILGVLGLASLVSPAGVAVAPEALRFDIPVMVAVAVACLPIFFNRHLIARWEGGVFLAYYLAYTAYLILAATGSMLLPLFSSAMLGFVLPLSVLTLVIITGRALRERRLK